VRGPSGSGKSTLLALLSGELLPLEGDVRAHGRSLTAMTEGERRAYRGDALRAGVPDLRARRRRSMSSRTSFSRFRLHDALALDASAGARARARSSRASGLGGKRAPRDRPALARRAPARRDRARAGDAADARPRRRTDRETCDPALKREIAALLVEECAFGRRAALVVATHDESILCARSTGVLAIGGAP
jgi:hypothetical protein